MKQTTTWIVLGIFLTAASGCGGGNRGGGSGGEVKLQGAGASFPALVYNKWFKDFSKASGGKITVDYQSQGSGAGVKAVIDGTVDFGASDAAMTKEEQDKVSRGVVCLPLTAGSISLAYNVDDVANLKLSRDAYAGIFLGNITKWNDPAIAKTNPDVKLPDAPITVVVRQDSSGTSYVFTKHLSAISPEFNKSPGTNKAPNWDKAFIKSKGNEGIASSLRSTKNSIGYIETGYLMTAKNLKQAFLENKDGAYIEATTESARKALASAEIPEDLIAWAPDPAGKDSYPIVTYTWLLCYKTYDDAAKMNALKDVIKYCLTDGQKSAEGLGYVPLPESVVASATKALDSFTLQKKADRAAPSVSAFAAR